MDAIESLVATLSSFVRLLPPPRWIDRMFLWASLGDRRPVAQADAILQQEGVDRMAGDGIPFPDPVQGRQPLLGLHA